MLEHCSTECPHKGLEYCRSVELDAPPRDGPVKCHQRLGGLPRSYYRDAA